MGDPVRSRTCARARTSTSTPVTAPIHTPHHPPAHPSAAWHGRRHGQQHRHAQRLAPLFRRGLATERRRQSRSRPSTSGPSVRPCPTRLVAVAVPDPIDRRASPCLAVVRVDPPCRRPLPGMTVFFLFDGSPYFDAEDDVCAPAASLPSPPRARAPACCPCRTARMPPTCRRGPMPDPHPSFRISPRPPRAPRLAGHGDLPATGGGAPRVQFRAGPRAVEEPAAPRAPQRPPHASHGERPFPRAWRLPPLQFSRRPRTKRRLLKHTRVRLG